jgi:hypothetical protein
VRAVENLNRGCRILSAGIALLASLPAGAQVNVTTWHNDLARSGLNAQETLLTTANVNSTEFGKLFSIPLDGQAFAQPLILSGVSIDGGTHNVVYIVTEHDSLRCNRHSGYGPREHRVCRLHRRQRREREYAKYS